MLPARDACAAGWALSGGPLTPRILASAAAAVSAAGPAPSPAILETILRETRLEGTIARSLRRRRRLITTSTSQVTAAWDAIARDLHPGPEIRSLLASQTPPDLPDTAAAAASGILSGVYIHGRHATLTAAVRDALHAAIAEGTASALALDAARHGRLTPPAAWTAGRQNAPDQAGIPELPLLAQEWLTRILGATGRQITAMIIRAVTRGTSHGQLCAAVTSALTASGPGPAPASRAIAAYLDQAMVTAAGHAAIAFCQARGIAQARYIAGDRKPCPACQAWQDASPYPAARSPVPGADTHPYCECILLPGT